MHNEADEPRGPLECDLADVAPVNFRRVSDPQSRERWKQLVQRCHYLGVRQPTGPRLHYLVYAGQQPIGALGWKGVR